jgi:hypothetical protein
VTVGSDGRRKGERSFDVTDTERAALLIVRAWRAPGGSTAVRVIRIDELPGGSASTLVTGDRDELAEQVLDWYDAFGEQGPAQDGS